MSRRDPQSLRPNESLGLAAWGEFLGVHRSTVYRRFRDQTWKLGRRRLLQKKYVARAHPYLFTESA